MNWFYDLAQPFVWHPTRVFIIALVWLLAAFIFRKTVRQPLFVAAGAWGVFALFEFEAWRERADIRVDLLFTWPVLCLLTIGCLYLAIKQYLTRKAA